MVEIQKYILKVFTIPLNDEEARDFIEWFEENQTDFKTLQQFRTKANQYLLGKYGGRVALVHEDSTASLQALVDSLKKETKKN